jgi:hypothetical protein
VAIKPFDIFRGMVMPTNKLRGQAARFLAWALEAQERGHMLEAHELTMKAAECLEDAMSLEQLRAASARSMARAVRPQS